VVGEEGSGGLATLLSRDRDGQLRAMRKMDVMDTKGQLSQLVQKVVPPDHLITLLPRASLLSINLSTGSKEGRGRFFYLFFLSSPPLPSSIRFISRGSIL